MQKIALSLAVIAASGAYVWQHAQNQPADSLDGPMLLESDSGPASPPLPKQDIAPVQTTPVQTTTVSLAKPRQQPQNEPLPTAVPVAQPPTPLPRPDFRVPAATITRAAITLVAQTGFADGTFTGPVTDAYYGPMQIQAIVQGGRLTQLKVLQYPNDRRTSIAINRQALPMLRDEAVSAQSANVDIISGATLTSEAFIRSLGGALNQARP